MLVPSQGRMGRYEGEAFRQTPSKDNRLEPRHGSRKSHRAAAVSLGRTPHGTYIGTIGRPASESRLSPNRPPRRRREGHGMNANLRNLALWVIIVLLLLALFTLFQNPGQRTSSQDISYSQMIK